MSYNYAFRQQAPQLRMQHFTDKIVQKIFNRKKKLSARNGKLQLIFTIFQKISIFAV